MIGLVVFLIVVFLLALGFTWLADQPGSLLVLKLGEYQFAQENLAVIAALAFAVFLVMIFTWILISMVWKTPGNIGSFFRNKRREKGWHALADGVIAVGAGDISGAKKAARQSQKFLPEEPVTKLLSAQAAQMEGKQDEARQAFEAMLERPDTRLIGLRGLFMEAEAAGESEAARHFVEEAAATRPGLEWSGRALLSMQAANGEWERALVTLQQNTDAKLYDRKEAKRLRAVLLTADAMELEQGHPQRAKERALEAHRLAPELVPAAVIAARVLARTGDLRKASKTIETTWRLSPHPDLMSTYTHLRSGDSGVDRLKRAETLNAALAHHPEGVMGVARAQMDVEDWEGARKTLAQLLSSALSERVCLMMAEIEEGQYGDRGRVREWLSRAVRAPRDATWTADGYVADEWAPVSPTTGALDAFEWRAPVESLRQQVDLAIDAIPSGPRELPSPEIADTKALKPVKEGLIHIPMAETREANGASGETPATVPEKTFSPPVMLDMSDVPDTPIRPTAAPKAQKSDSDAAMTASIKTEKPLEKGEESGADQPNRVADDGDRVPGIRHATARATTGAQPRGSDDPIMKPPIDDPGIREKSEAAPKRFKLF